MDVRPLRYEKRDANARAVQPTAGQWDALGSLVLADIAVHFLAGHDPISAELLGVKLPVPDLGAEGFVVQPGINCRF
jgi:hypothetical protein